VEHLALDQQALVNPDQQAPANPDQQRNLRDLDLPSQPKLTLLNPLVHPVQMTLVMEATRNWVTTTNITMADTNEDGMVDMVTRMVTLILIVEHLALDQQALANPNQQALVNLDRQAQVNPDHQVLVNLGQQVLANPDQQRNLLDLAPLKLTLLNPMVHLVLMTLAKEEKRDLATTNITIADTREDGTGMGTKMVTLILNQPEHPFLDQQALNQQVAVDQNQLVLDPNQAAPNHQDPDHLGLSQVIVVDLKDLVLLNLQDHDHLVAGPVAVMVAKEVVRRLVTITDIITTISTTNEKLHQWNLSLATRLKVTVIMCSLYFKS